MKVSELITELQKYDSNLDVMRVADGEYWWPEPTLIEPIPFYHDGNNLPYNIRLDHVSDQETEIIDHIRQNGYINLGML